MKTGTDRSMRNAGGPKAVREGAGPLSGGGTGKPPGAGKTPGGLARFGHRVPAAALCIPLLLGCGSGTGDGGQEGDTLLAQEVAGAEVASALSGRTPPPAAPSGGPGQVPTTRPSQEVDASRTTALVLAANRVAPAVVSVNVLRQQQIRARSLWDQFFLPPGGASRQSTGYGSGIIFHEAGYILTNHHVVRGAQEIRVTLPDGRDFDAELLGTDGVTDVAVLKVEGENLPVAPLGTSQGLMTGEWAMAIGNPFSYLLSNAEPTVTAGVISALGRHIIPQDEDRSQGVYLGMIQTDASINPGNSGGPLVNARGEVIGVNTSIFSRSGGSEGLGFAIPIDRALRVAADLMQFGELRRAWTGVDVEPVEADAWGRTRGVRISRVMDGSPGDEAGLSEGDRLTRANGRRLATPMDLEAVLLDLKAGEPVELEVEGRRRAFQIITETLPTSRAERVEVLEDLEVISVTPEIDAERNLGVTYGALITGISPQLQRSLGLTLGDVIVQINNTRILTAEEAAREIRELDSGNQVLMRWIRRGRLFTQTFYVRRDGE